MSITLRGLLIISALFTFIYIAHKIRKSQIRIYDAIYWIFSSFLFLFMSIFPRVMSELAFMLGVKSPVNFVYLIIIFLLFIKCFMLSIKLSVMEEKFKDFVEEYTVRDQLKGDRL